MPLFHKFVNPNPDSSITTLTRPSNWNDSHSGTIDVLSLSVYSCSGSIVLAPGVTGTCIVLVAASGVTGANITTVTLPAASGCAVKGVGLNQVSAAKFTVKKKDTGVGWVTINATGNDLIEGLYQQITLINPGQFVMLVSDGGPPFGGSGWWIVGQN